MLSNISKCHYSVENNLVQHYNSLKLVCISQKKKTKYFSLAFILNILILYYYFAQTLVIRISHILQ